MNSEQLTELVVTTLDDNKARDIKQLNVRDLTDVVDEMIICSATSTRHAAALADHVRQASKAAGVQPLGMEGEDKGEWVLIDLHDVIVHIMLPETREFYNLEKLWAVSAELRQKAANQ